MNVIAEFARNAIVIEVDRFVDVGVAVFDRAVRQSHAPTNSGRLSKGTLCRGRQFVGRPQLTPAFAFW
jgi:hypothetical protein